MQQFTWTVLDEFVSTSSQHVTTYSPAQLVDGLGSVDQLLIELTVDRVLGKHPSVDLQIEHSGDGMHWLNKRTKAELAGIPLLYGKNYVPFAFDDGLVPTLAFVRIRVTLHGEPNPPNPLMARINVVVTGNDYNEAAFRAALGDEEDQAVDHEYTEQGIRACAAKYGPGALLPASVSSYASPTDYNYLTYITSQKKYQVRPPYTVCVSSDHLITIMKGTKVIHRDTWGDVTNSQEESHA